MVDTTGRPKAPAGRWLHCVSRFRRSAVQAQNLQTDSNTFSGVVTFIGIGLLGCLLNYYLISWLTTTIYGWSIYLGLIWSLWYAVVAAAAIAGLRSAIFQNPSAGSVALGISMIASLLVWFAGAVAAIAFGLEQLALVRYAGGASVTFKMLYEHFLWQFVDMIPELDVWKVLRLDDPVQEVGLWAGLLLIAYKIFVIYVVIATVKKLLDD